MAVATTTAILGAAAIGAAGAVASASIASSAQKKAQSEAEQFAREQQQAADENARRLEEKYGLSTGELAREWSLTGVPEGETMPTSYAGSEEAKQLAMLRERAGMTGEELLKEAGPETERLYNLIGERLGISGEELFRREGETGTALADQILMGAKTPGGTFESTLSQELELARQMVNQEANRRGVFGGLPEGGIRFEQLGRAAIDLAVKSAEAKQAARQQDLANAMTAVSNYATMSEKARGESATLSSSALSEQERARTELETFLSNMETLSQNAKQRTANVGIGASQLAQNQRGLTTDEIMSLYGTKAGEAAKSKYSALESIGKIGGNLISNLPTETKKTETNTKTLGLEDLLKTPDFYNTKLRLSNLTGSSMT
jgi:hypothetical protein